MSEEAVLLLQLLREADREQREVGGGAVDCTEVSWVKAFLSDLVETEGLQGRSGSLTCTWASCGGRSGRAGG